MNTADHGPDADGWCAGCFGPADLCTFRGLLVAAPILANTNTNKELTR